MARITNCRPDMPNAIRSARSMSAGTRARIGASSLWRLIADHLSVSGRDAAPERTTELAAGTTGTTGTVQYRLRSDPPRSPRPAGTASPLGTGTGATAWPGPPSAERPGTAGRTRLVDEAGACWWPVPAGRWCPGWRRLAYSWWRAAQLWAACLGSRRVVARRLLVWPGLRRTPV